MKTKHWRLLFIMALTVVMLGVVAHADKHKKVLLPGVVKAAINALYPQAAIE